MNRKLTIMPCLDMINGRVVKGVNFVNIKDAGDPVECCKAYCAAGADELAMLDITATVEGRKTMLEVVRKVADAVTVPFTMGGGISSVAAAEEVLKAGANKVSTSSAVFRRPEMIGEMVKELGADKVTVAIDVAQNAAMPSGYEVFIDGGRTATGKDAIEWAKQVNDYGVGDAFRLRSVHRRRTHRDRQGRNRVGEAGKRLRRRLHPAYFQVHGRRAYGL